MRPLAAALALAACASLAAQDAPEFASLYRKALALREQQLGPQHPKTVESRLDLGLYLAAQGANEEAETLIEQAYAALAEAQPPNPQRAAVALASWADLRLRQGDGAGAEALLKQQLSLLEPTAAVRGEVWERLATLKRLQGDLDEAQALYRQALQSGRIASRLRNLAVVLEAQGATAEAEQLHREALALQRVELGADPETALTLNSLGLLAAARQDWTAAATYFVESRDLFAQTLGPQSAETATAIDNLGNVRRATGDFDDAENLLQTALSIRRQALGPNDPDTAATLNNLAGLYHVQGRLADAEPLYRASMAARTEAFGPADAVAAETLYNLAHLLRQKGESAAARQSFETALNILEAAYGASDPFVGEIRKALAGLDPKGRNGSLP
jgi:tetratricopeptide (TPR) repeat protein